MSQRMKISDEITVGPQPSADEIEKIAAEGFASLINFRTAGEDDQPLSPDAEQQKVEANGLKYLHIPVSMQDMSPELVDRFREKFSELPKPVFAHCQSGKRAGAMVMMHMAAEQGMSGEQTLTQAKKMGFECDQPELEQFVKTYVDSRSAR
ncbi:beta-lactamase hydrolase domain-containing protein [Novipirellula sp.]|uniref:beta-lactamase hydrolase domain-containing protein n=1 Tax=Novipirellula sp. TaxID=2795430 RepID=UPI003569313E